MESNEELLEIVVQRLVDELKDQLQLEYSVEQLRNCISSNPAEFLHRYGSFITETEQESLFGKLAEQDWLVKTELWRLRKQRGRLCSSQHNIVRNRRLAALQDLYSEGQYFSDKQMERRDPLLYYRLWGRYASYLKSSELEQIRNNDSLAHIYPSKVNLSNASEEAAINKEISEDVVQSTRKGEPSRPLTDYLMEYFDAKDIVVKRMEQRREEKDNTKTKRLSFGFHNAFGQMKSETEYVEEQLMEQASDEENEGDISQWTLEDFQQCREELIVAMRQRFLNGEDTAFFDYSTVDNNEHYDWADWIQNDVEENYFDRQEPQRISFMEQDEHSTEE